MADGVTDGTTDGLRPGEETVALPGRFDAELYFIGRIATPWRARGDCPKQGDAETGPACTVLVDARFAAALAGIAAPSHLQLLYWMDRARRDIVRQRPRAADGLRGTFALRSPVRPNPIASSIVRLAAISGTTLVVHGLDCLDGTPLLDIKPVRCPVVQAQVR